MPFSIKRSSDFLFGQNTNTIFIGVNANCAEPKNTLRIVAGLLKFDFVFLKFESTWQLLIALRLTYITLNCLIL